MKTLASGLTVLVWHLALCGSALGSVVGTSLIHQPIHPGAAANPARIPLGSVPVESNHGYDIHGVTTESRWSAAATIGAAGVEQNLAVLAGISLSGITLGSAMTATDGPITLQVPAGRHHACTPYTKAQVVAAVIHCLLSDWIMTPRRPLIIEITTADPADADLHRFAGHYVNQPNSPEHGFIPTRVPGSRIETDARGVQQVVFEQRLVPQAAVKEPSPGFAPCLFGQEEGSDPFWAILPTWPVEGWKGNPCELTVQPFRFTYKRVSWGGPFEQCNSLLPGASLHGAVLRGFAWREGIKGAQATLILASTSNEESFVPTVATTCYALILGAQPKPSRPLRIELRVNPSAKHLLAAFTASSDWKTSESVGEFVLACDFAWDPDNRTLVSGSVPGHGLDLSEGGTWLVTAEQKNNPHSEQ